MTVKQSLDLAIIGNSSIAALIDRAGRIVWGCWPRIDGDPVFCTLLNGEAAEDGFLAVEADGPSTTEQSYLRNTAIVRTVHKCGNEGSFAVTDFVPRFRQHNRIFRPPMIIRMVEPLRGLCRIRVRMRPVMGYGGQRPAKVPGSNHVRYVTDGTALRLTTDAPIAYLVGENGFVLTRAITLIVHADETLSDSMQRMAQEFLEQTRDYWHDWVRYLSVPYEWQEAVIRAAVTLKLCSFEETGAMVAALTTSIPEAEHTARNWDYRYCWIRDAFFTVHALNRLGATLTMERFIDYITDVVAMGPGQSLKPVYAIVPEDRLDERVADHLAGYRGHAPVRIGNAAVLQTQHDVYGSVILAASQMFFDERLPEMGSRGLYDRLEPLAGLALERALEPDAGIWEYRGRSRVHTYSAAMCWVACDRLARIAKSLGLAEKERRWSDAAETLRETILKRAWNEARGYIAGSLGGEELDASVLLLHEVGLVAADDARFRRTVEAIGRTLVREGHVMRYRDDDDFGPPKTAFTACTFWYIDALAALGRGAEARRLFDHLLTCRNHVGLLAEDLDPVTGEMWGNFPQTYAMAGIILSAMKLSRGWEAS